LYRQLVSYQSIMSWTSRRLNICTLRIILSLNFFIYHICCVYIYIYKHALIFFFFVFSIFFLFSFMIDSAFKNAFIIISFSFVRCRTETKGIFFRLTKKLLKQARERLHSVRVYTFFFLRFWMFYSGKT
jgi:hypothetical protein